jgi:phosphoenolpyruvate synthase/pyruvate phosphate dikinase
MPGMMDTVLNLGLNDIVVENLAKHTSPRFAYDCYRRLLDMYADVVLGAEHELFEKELSAVRTAKGVKFDVELSGGAFPHGAASLHITWINIASSFHHTCLSMQLPARIVYPRRGTAIPS